MRPIISFFLVFGFLSSLFGQRLQDGLIFYAPFDGSTINLVEWGKPHNHGVRFVADKFGKVNGAVFFDGLEAYLDYGNIASFGARDFSISFWVRPSFSPDASFADTGLFLAKGLFAPTANKSGLGLGISLSPEYESTLTLVTETEAFSALLPSEKAGSDNVLTQTLPWQHLILVRSGEELQFYLNGRLSGVRKMSDQISLRSVSSLLLGAPQFPNDNFRQAAFSGTLDELRIYDRGLTSLEIDRLYQQFSGQTSGEVTAEARIKSVDLTIYPNPTSRLLNLRFRAAKERTINIVDARGRQLRYLRSDQREESIPVAGLPPGTYFVRVNDGTEVISRKFLKTGAVLP